MGKTNISWCTHSLNFLKWWCTKISPGCKHCYMMTLRERYPQHGADGPVWRDKAWQELKSFPSGAEIFVGDMYDVFHEDMPLEFIKRHFETAVEMRPNCTFLFLTKRIERAAELLTGYQHANVWLGTSVENQKYAYRIDVLRAIPYVRKFLSIEPLLGPIDADFSGMDGVITGGESGMHLGGPSHPRWMKPEWAIGVRDQCRRDDVLFYHKQGSGRFPGMNRELDGRTYDALPWRVPVPVQETLL